MEMHVLGGLERMKKMLKMSASYIVERGKVKKAGRWCD
jgi:hypothetical protein